LFDALADAKLEPRALVRTANAILDAESRNPTKAGIERALGMLARGEDVAGRIETDMRRAMMKELELDALLKDAQVAVTDAGLKSVSGPLAEFFSQAVNDKQIAKPLLRQVLVAALEDRIQEFRFATKPADAQLKSLTDAQRKKWESTQTMTHVRLKAD